jgi:hypothetical protein
VDVSPAYFQVYLGVGVCFKWLGQMGDSSDDEG